VPTFTTSNERMLLLLADGASGMLRVEDAERLQVGAALFRRGARLPHCSVLQEMGKEGGLVTRGAACARLACVLHTCPASTQLTPQGLPEGHTRPCWPIQTPGVGAHRARPPRTEADAEAAASKRWDLLGERVCFLAGELVGCMLHGVMVVSRDAQAEWSRKSSSGAGTNVAHYTQTPPRDQPPDEQAMR